LQGIVKVCALLMKFPERAKYPSTVPDSPLPDKCYRCIEQVNCASSEDKCGWYPSERYANCIAECTKPDPVVPLPNPCISKNPCDCLKSDANCTLCQFTRTFSDDSGDFKVPFSACIPKVLSNKCVADYSADGFAGSLIYTRPAACDISTVKDAFDPSTVVPSEYEDIKQIVKSVTDGKFNAGDYQKVLDELQITDIVVEVVGQPTTDGVKGKITVIITIVKQGRTQDQIIGDLKRALAKFFNIKIERIESTLQAAKDATTTKRFQSQQQSSFLSSSVISPDSTVPGPSGVPNPGGQQPTFVPAPSGVARLGFGLLAVWLVGLIALLF